MGVNRLTGINSEAMSTNTQSVIARRRSSVPGCDLMQTLFLSERQSARRRVAALGMSPAQEIYFRLVLKLRERRKGNFARDVVIEIDVVCARTITSAFFTADGLKGIFGKIA